MIPELPKDLSDIQRSPLQLRRAQKLMTGVARYDPKTAGLVRYLGEFITLKCAPDMLALGLFPNAKEISESFGAYEAVRRYCQDIDLGDPSVAAVAVGDGCTPRTAATFAFRSAWQCHSIDPKLRGGTLRWSKIQRLTLHVAKAKDVKPIQAETAIVLAVHSHAPLAEAILAVNAKRIVVVAIPCCVKQKLLIPPDKVYEDQGIISPKREVLIWYDVAGCPEFTQPGLFQ